MPQTYPERVRRAIGWYYTDATPAEKVAACRAAMIEAAAEMVMWGASPRDVEDAVEEAQLAAEQEHDEMLAAGSVDAA